MQQGTSDGIQHCPNDFSNQSPPQSSASQGAGEPQRRPSCLKREGESKGKAITFDSLPFVYHHDATRCHGGRPRRRISSTVKYSANSEELPRNLVIKPPSARQAYAAEHVLPEQSATGDFTQGGSAEQDFLLASASSSSAGLLFSLDSLPESKCHLDQHRLDERRLEEQPQDGENQQASVGSLPMVPDTNADEAFSRDASATTFNVLPALSGDGTTILNRPQDAEGMQRDLSEPRCKNSVRILHAIAAAREYMEDDGGKWVRIRTEESLKVCDGALKRSSSITSVSSESSVESLDHAQEELIIFMKNLGMHVLLPDDYHDGIDLQLGPEVKGVVVASPMPAPRRTFLLVQKLLRQEKDLPTIVLLLKKHCQTTTSYSSSIERFLKMGIGDVIVQPSNDTDIESVLRVSLRRFKQKKIKLIAQLEREANLVWSHGHKIYSNLPRINDSLKEPDIGVKLGRHHEIISVLNHGKRAKVFLAMDTRTLEPRVLKCIPKLSLRKATDIKSFVKELVSLKKLRHLNVIALFGEAHSMEHLMLLLQFGGRRNLFQLLESKPDKRLVVEEARMLWSQVVEALAHCHSCDLTHRDVKPESVTVSDDGGTARLVGFGYAEPSAAPLRHPGFMPFVAPEVMVKDMSSFSAPAADIWAMGLTLLEMLIGVQFLPRMLGWSKQGTPDKKHAHQVLELFSDAKCQQSLWEAVEPGTARELRGDVALSKLLVGILDVSVPDRWPVSKVQRSPWLPSNLLRDRLSAFATL